MKEKVSFPESLAEGGELGFPLPEIGVNFGLVC
jgi:hypothetical protein